ncbi:amino acid adenylation domain-containing protein [Verrucomicrobiales bacterium]|nr:amino acid adenylation domain-containing protein [Verrucomicrobiales bacterium]
MSSSTAAPPIHVSATFTADPLSDVFAFWAEKLGSESPVGVSTFAPFAQVFQELLDPSSGAATGTGAAVFLVRAGDLGEDADRFLETYTEFVRNHANRNHLLILCPDKKSGMPLTTPKVPGAEVLTADDVAALYPDPDPFDSEAEDLGGVPYTTTFFAALGTFIIRRLRAQSAKPVKVIATDADNTLWGGVAAEDGPEKIELAPGHLAYHAWLKSQADAGVLLALCSKNNRADVDKIFEERDDLGVQLQDFTAMKLGWQPKSENLLSLADDLNVGADSILFLDDNPAEIAEVRGRASSMTAIPVPLDPANYPSFLGHIWPLDQCGASTAADETRAQTYEDEEKRREAQQGFSSFDDFLSSLDLEVTIREATLLDLPRIAQLYVRTNQFNTTAPTQGQASDEHHWVVTAKDRFGDYGLVGTVHAEERDAGRTLHVPTFLLSCRALGKGIEHKVLEFLAGLGPEMLSISLKDTGKNAPALEFFNSLAGAQHDINIVSISAEDARKAASNVSRAPEESGEKSEGSETATDGTPRTDVAAIYGEIATSLRNAAQIRDAITARTRPRPADAPAYIPPVTPSQKIVAAAWSKALGIKEIGQDDRFAELGGKSVQLLRVYAALPEPKPEFTALFSHPRVADLAAHLDALNEPEKPVEVEQPAPAIGVPLIKPLPQAKAPPSAEEDKNPPIEVAIVGYSLRVPGADTPDEFWELIANGRSGISTLSDEQLAAAGFDPSALRADPDFVAARGLMKDPTGFDAAFFGMLPKEARLTDPQQRVFLELCWEALERAGTDPYRYTKNIGVFAGAYFDSYLLANLCSDPEFLKKTVPSIQVGDLQAELGNDKDYLATRVAYKLDLRGPAFTLQSACSSSLVAVSQAFDSIRSGACEMALAGGVTITFPQEKGYQHEEGSILSKDGACRAFDHRASGTVFSNGAAVLVLKNLAEAKADGDPILAVLKGAALNNDGAKKQSFTAPSVEGQADVIRRAHAIAGVTPDTISMVEAHGTGTPLGDPIELSGLTKAFRTGTDQSGFCAITSAKTNIGHLDTASGATGVIKTVLALQYQAIPPLAGFEKPNPKAPFADSPFYPAATLEKWGAPPGVLRRAGVSSFGVGGTNAHVVLEEAPENVESDLSWVGRPLQVFPVSAKTETALDSLSESIANYEGNGRTPAVARTLQEGRAAHRYRRAVIGDSPGDKRRSVNGNPLGDAPPVVLLFAGQGAQHPGMAQGLYENEPVFKAEIDRCAEILKQHLGSDIREALYPSDAESNSAAEALQNTVLAQPAIFVVGYATAKLWESWGIKPAAAAGHSIGEFIAACLAGVFSLESALLLIAERGRLLGSLPGGSMLSVRLSEEALAPLIENKNVDLASVNGADLCVVAGPDEDIAALAQALEAQSIPAKLLHTSHAFHSRMVEPVVEPFEQIVRTLELKPPSFPILSTVTGDWMTEAEATDPRYWARHLRAPVRFYDAAKAFWNAPGHIFLEAGPGQTLTTLLAQNPDKSTKTHATATYPHPAGGNDQDDYAHALGALGQLWCWGVNPDWTTVRGGACPTKLNDLPTYPFERKNFVIEPTPMTATTAPAALPVTPDSPPPEAMAPAAPADRKPRLTSEFREVLADLCGMEPEEIATNASFLELGFDSLLLTQVAKGINDAFGVRITMRQLLSETPSVETVVAHLDATMPADVAPAPVAPVQAPAPIIATNSANPALDSVIQQQLAQLDMMRAQISALAGNAVAPVPVPAPEPVIVSGETAAPAAPPTIAFGADTSAVELTPAQQSHLDDLVARYTQKTAASKALTAEYRSYYADPRTASGFKPAWKEMIYQIATESSKGSHFTDIDGNDYVDMLNGFGPGFFGHSPDFVVEAVQEQLAKGYEVGPQMRLAGETAKLFCELTGADRASFVCTGSEAAQAAMRLTRTVTGRDKIVVFDRDYHGNFDEVLVRQANRGDKLRTLPMAPGVPRNSVAEIIVLEYGSDASLAKIRELAPDLAAVVIEPVQSRQPELRPKEFIQEIRRITEASGTAMVFDEVITGFRTGLKGAQEYYGIEADLACYGKVVGGGMPIGVVAGKREFMDTFDGGHWEYGDDSMPVAPVTFFAGTFVRHPLAIAACRACLLHMKELPENTWLDLRERATTFVEGIGALFEETGFPAKVVNFGSQIFIRVDASDPFANLLFFHLREKGVFLLEGFPSYITLAHTEEDLARVTAAFKESVYSLQSAGFCGGKVVEELPSECTTTAAQREIFLACKIDPTFALAFNEVTTLHMLGELDLPALRRALDATVAQHSALRATFSGDGTTLRINETLEIELAESTDIDATVDHEATTGFDLENGPLLRATVVRNGDTDHTLVLNIHHVVCDGLSYNNVIDTLARAYAPGREDTPALAPASQFPIFAATQPDPDEHTKSLDYWTGIFANDIPNLDLPLSYPRPAVLTYDGATVFHRIGSQLTENVRVYGARNGATLQSTLTAAFAALIYKLSGTKDLVIGIPAAQHAIGDATDMVGHTVNMLPLRLEMQPDAQFTAALETTRDALLGAFEHQACTYSEVLQKLPDLKRDASRTTLVDLSFTLERMDTHSEFEGLETVFAPVPKPASQNTLFLNAIQSSEGLLLEARFNTALLKDTTVGRWLSAFEVLLEQITANPEIVISSLKTNLGSNTRPVPLKGPISLKASGNENVPKKTTPAIPVAPPSENFPAGADITAKIPIVQRPEADQADKPLPLLHDGFLRSVAETPTAPAIIQGVTTLTFAELDKRSTAVAGALQAEGVGPGHAVIICHERTPDLIAAVFGVLKIGACFVPVDPADPESRKVHVAKETGAAVCIGVPITGIRHATVESCVASAQRYIPVAIPESYPAYIIFTSGSTGSPKGVVISHATSGTHCKNSARFYGLTTNDHALVMGSATFDIFIEQVFSPFFVGAALVLRGDTVWTPREFHDTAAASGITHISLTPAYLHELFAFWHSEKNFSELKIHTIIGAGDVMNPQTVAFWRELENRPRLFNGYGPTEETVYTTIYQVQETDRPEDEPHGVPIGTAIANRTVTIVDKDGNAVPHGEDGEICIGGSSHAIGYLNDPRRTKASWEDDPESTDGGKRYKSGDRGVVLPTGNIAFLGRIDHQLKIRGFRVEAGEIETAIRSVPEVGQSLVVKTDAGELVGYMTPSNGTTPDPAKVREHLAASLPDYMVPSVVLPIAEFPLTPNGKIDRNHLPDPVTGLTTGDPSQLSSSEQKLAELWKEVLKLEEVGPEDDFFLIGGHSMAGLQLFTKIEKTFGKSLPLGTLFTAPTIRSLATHLTDAQIDSGLSSTPAPETEPAPEQATPPESEKPSAHSQKIRIPDVVPVESPVPTIDPMRTYQAPPGTTIQPVSLEGDLPPLFCIHGGDGGTLFYRPLAHALQVGRPVFAIESPMLSDSSITAPPDTIEEAAANYVKQVRAVRPEGPYILSGYSYGGIVAFEMAQQLRREGHDVPLLILFDTVNPAYVPERNSLGERVASNWSKDEMASQSKRLKRLGGRTLTGLFGAIKVKMENTTASALKAAGVDPGSSHLQGVQLREAHGAVQERYVPTPYDGDVLLLPASDNGDKFVYPPDLGWEGILTGHVTITSVPGEHLSIFDEEHTVDLAAAVRPLLRPLESAADASGVVPINPPDSGGDLPAPAPALFE